MNRALTLFSLLLGLSLALASGAQARTWTVEKDGSGDFTIVQDALDAAAPGDTVQVGVGRFDDFAVSQGASNLMIIAQVRTASVVLKGLGPDTTILGPEVRLPDTPQLEYGIVRLEPGLELVIEDLALENSRAGVNNSGRLTLDNVRVSGHWAGIFDGSSDPLVVRNSHFEECTDYGVRGGSANTSVTVEDCTFFNAQGAVFFNSVESGVVRRCTFSSTEHLLNFIMVTQGSDALVEDCRFLASPDYYGVWVISASATVNDNWFGEGRVNVGGTNGCYIEGSGNVLRGGNLQTIRLSGYTSGISFHGNDIYNPFDHAVGIDAYLLDPILPLDLTNNWWGTTDPAEIEAGIIYEFIGDGVDVEVQWDLFLTVPVPVKTSSTGGLKARFRSR